MRTKGLVDLFWALLPIAVALGITTLILWLAGVAPLEAYRHLIGGAVEGADERASTLSIWSLLLICSAGLLITFTAGLWNIGIEGQIMAGAILTTAAVYALWLPRALYIPLLLAAGMVGGALWGLLAGLLKLYGRVHEIFGGVGLNYIATVVASYLIFGPWKPADGATMSGTDPFPSVAWLPRLGTLPLSPLAMALAVIALGAVAFALQGTQLGLELKATGKSPYAAFLRGIPTRRLVLLAFVLCGALAGLTGAILALDFRQRLIPQIAGGYGFLAILIVLLAGFRAAWVFPIALFFAALSIGGPKLEMAVQIDSSLAGVFQTTIVLCVLLFGGIRAYLRRQGA